MKRTILLAAFMGSAVLLASGVLAGFGLTGASAQTEERPNILLVVTDDLDARSDSISHMEDLRSLVANRGVTFSNLTHTAYYSRQTSVAPGDASAATSRRGKIRNRLRRIEGQVRGV